MEESNRSVSKPRGQNELLSKKGNLKEWDPGLCPLFKDSLHRPDTNLSMVQLNKSISADTCMGLLIDEK